MLTRRSWRLIPILPVLAAAACGGGQGTPAPARSAAHGDACREEAARGVAALFADLSAGRWRAADRRVARRDFVWFVIGARRGGSSLPRLAVNRTVEVRGALPAYLRQRARAHDAVVVRSLRVTHATGGVVSFELAAVRRADDLAARRPLPLIAKGEWECGPGRLRGLAGHADLDGGPLPAGVPCPRSSRPIAGVDVC